MKRAADSSVVLTALAVFAMCVFGLSCGGNGQRSETKETMSFLRPTPTRPPTPTNEQKVELQKTWAAGPPGVDDGFDETRKMMSTHVTREQIDAMQARKKVLRRQVMDTRLEQVAETASPEQLQALRKQLQENVDNPPEWHGPARGDQPWRHQRVKEAGGPQ